MGNKAAVLPLYHPAALLKSLGVSVTPTGGGSGPRPSASAPASTISRTPSPDPHRVCKDGERTSHLTSLAGMWIAKGKQLDEVMLLARGWNALNTPPLDDDKVVSTCEGIWKTDQRNNPQRHAATASLRDVPLFDIAEASITSMLRTQPPAQRWLLKNLLPIGKVATLIAGGGTGKSQLALQLGITVATGYRLADAWDAGETGDVLLLFAEDDYEEIHRRFNRTITHIRKADPSFGQQLDQHLFIRSLVSMNNLMTQAVDRSRVEPTEFVDRLILTLKAMPDIKLIVIDPLSRFRGGDENSAEDVTRWVEQAERLAKSTGATVLVLHHVNKGSYQANEQTQAASRGSSAFTDGVRFVMNLSQPSDAQFNKLGMPKDVKSRVLLAGVTKNNYARPQEPVFLYREDSGYLTNLATYQGKPLTIEDRVCRLIYDEAQKGNSYSVNGLEQTFGGHQGVFAIGKLQLRKVLTAMIASNRLTKDKGKLVAKAYQPLASATTPPTP